MNKFYLPDSADERMTYAESKLENMGYRAVKKIENADFILIAPGNIEYRNNPLTVKYFDDNEFLIKNAFLTAEIAVGLAIINSDLSVSDSNVLILGYGRIAKALQMYMSAFTKNITICARNENARLEAECRGASVVDFDNLENLNDYDYVFNTVPFPVMTQKELNSLKKSCLLMELASLPGGIDKHYAELSGLKLISAGRLPARFAPAKAGLYVAEAVDKVVKGAGV